MKIKNRFTGKILYESEHKTMKETVEQAVKETTDLWEADLREANLSGANLRKADLSEADLREANLREANLSGASLSGANLSEANLWKADLREADLWEADLRKADLRKADLWKADLREANLWEADLNCTFYKTKVTKQQKEVIVNSDLFEVFINNGLQNPDAKSTYESLKVTGEFIYKKAKEEERKKLLNSQKRNKELKRQIVNMQDE